MSTSVHGRKALLAGVALAALAWQVSAFGTMPKKHESAKTKQPSGDDAGGGSDLPDLDGFADTKTQGKSVDGGSDDYCTVDSGVCQAAFKFMGEDSYEDCPECYRPVADRDTCDQGRQLLKRGRTTVDTDDENKPAGCYFVTKNGDPGKNFYFNTNAGSTNADTFKMVCEMYKGCCGDGVCQSAEDCPADCSPSPPPPLSPSAVPAAFWDKVDDKYFSGGVQFPLRHESQVAYKTAISWDRKTLDDNDAGSIAVIVENMYMKDVKTLGLKDNDIGDAGIASIAEHLDKLESLEKLWLDSNDFGDVGMTAFVNAIKVSGTLDGLTHLFISGLSGLTYEGSLAEFANAVNKDNGALPALTYVEITMVAGDTGLTKLGAFTQALFNQSVQVLWKNP